MSENQVAYRVLPIANLPFAPHAERDAIGMGGLRSVDGRVFPLERIHVRTSIAGPCARSIVEQHFTNPFDDTLDATYIFPLPSEGAIVALELRAGDVVVVGECVKRADAQRAFEQARENGHRAALFETEQRGVHTLSLAGLPPRTAITVQLTVVEMLPAIDGRFRFQFPLVIAPRFTPGTEWGHAGYGTSPDTDAVPNASRLTPPLRLSGGTLLDLEIEIAGPISSIASSLHAVTMSLAVGSIRVAPSSVTTLDRDFILEFATTESSSVSTRAYTDGAYTVALVEAPASSISPALPRDAVFVVDISGSMQGEKLNAAKKAVTGALHGLQHGDRFRLLAFDDHVDHFHADFVAYTDDNLDAADAWIAALEARGGTSMLPPVQQSLTGDTAPGRVRTVLFITDGQSTDEARLLPAVANRRGHAIFFTLGIDTAVNASLLRQLAHVGGGVCELCTPSDDIDGVVAKIEARFGSPLVADVTAAGSARPDGVTVFAGRPAVMLLQGGGEVRMAGRAPQGTFDTTVTPQRIDFSLGALWARERVSWLEERLTLRPFEEEAIRPEIERIALEHRMASKYTSFVCVDKSVHAEGARRHVVQPVEWPDAWVEMEYRRAISVFDAMPSAADDSPSQAMYRSRPASLTRQLDTVRKRIRVPVEHQAPAPVPTRFSPPDNDVASVLARTQGANGSYRNDVGRSAAALLILLLLGVTRTKGDRRRVVVKLAAWLEQHRDDSRARMALDALDDVERSALTVPQQEWLTLAKSGPEGTMLDSLLRIRSR